MLRQVDCIQVPGSLPNTAWIFHIIIEHGTWTVIAHDEDNRWLLRFLENCVYRLQNLSIYVDHLGTVSFPVFLTAALKLICIGKRVSPRWIDRISIFIKNKWRMRHQDMHIRDFGTRNQGWNFLNFIEL